MKKPFDINTLLDDVITLPSLPGTVAHIMRLVSDPQCALSAVAQAISSDPPLAMKTLRLVNAAYYGLRQQVGTIEHAVVLLGIKVIKNLAFTATVFDIMKGSVETLFLHSVFCGAAMRAVIESGHPNAQVHTGEEAFVCGLLHDIGKVILDEFLPEECAKAAQLSRTEQIPSYSAEKQIIGVDHAEVGARLAQKWKLPDGISDGIACHHDLRRCKIPVHQQVGAMISIADFMCIRAGLGASENTVVAVSDDVWRIANVTSPEIPLILDKFFVALPTVRELMSLRT
ncbi:MAG: HDOD domain-containing protein [Candidatus Hydrogenedentes bacterium]|nr:HDOD domain-containing protein [Candidatus Hydrogenedentota bacterium]